MKALLIITTLFARVCCALGADFLDWEGLIAHKDSEKELRATPTISVLKTVQNTNSLTVVLLIENRTGIDIKYYGYNEDHPQVFIKEKRDGKWVATAWDWCGTGMERYLLEDKKKLNFEIRVPNGPIQIFTILRNAKDSKEFSLVKLYEKGDS